MSTKINGFIFKKSEMFKVSKYLTDLILSNDCFINEICRNEIKENKQLFIKESKSYLQIFEITKTKCFGRIVFDYEFSTLNFPIYYQSFEYAKYISYDTRVENSKIKYEQMSDDIWNLILNRQYILIPIFNYEICKNILKNY
jgi:hypothetical protein